MRADPKARIQLEADGAHAHRRTGLVAVLFEMNEKTLENSQQPLNGSFSHSLLLDPLPTAQANKSTKKYEIRELVLVFNAAKHEQPPRQQRFLLGVRPAHRRGEPHFAREGKRRALGGAGQKRSAPQIGAALRRNGRVLEGRKALD